MVKWPQMIIHEYFSVKWVEEFLTSRIPIKCDTVFCLLRAPPLIKAPPIVWGKANLSQMTKIQTVSFNNCPIFNPKPPLESLEPQLFTHNTRCDLANEPGALIRQNTVHELKLYICIHWCLKFTTDIAFGNKKMFSYHTHAQRESRHYFINQNPFNNYMFDHIVAPAFQISMNLNLSWVLDQHMENIAFCNVFLSHSCTVWITALFYEKTI